MVLSPREPLATATAYRRIHIAARSRGDTSMRVQHTKNHKKQHLTSLQHIINILQRMTRILFVSISLLLSMTTILAQTDSSSPTPNPIDTDVSLLIHRFIVTANLYMYAVWVSKLLLHLWGGNLWIN